MPALLFSVFQSLFSRIFTYLLSAGALKWIFVSIFLFGFSFFIDLLLSYLPDFLGVDLGDYLSALPPGVWYFLDYFELQFGFSLVLSAYFSRFMIRRIPFLG